VSGLGLRSAYGRAGAALLLVRCRIARTSWYRA